MTEKRQTSQGYIIRILQHFATKLRNITNFVMLFQAVMKFLSRHILIKISLIRGKVYCKGHSSTWSSWRLSKNASGKVPWSCTLLHYFTLDWLIPDNFTGTGQLTILCKVDLCSWTLNLYHCFILHFLTREILHTGKVLEIVRFRFDFHYRHCYHYLSLA
jgi:hypothetical protein